MTKRKFIVLCVTVMTLLSLFIVTLIAAGPPLRLSSGYIEHKGLVSGQNTLIARPYDKNLVVDEVFVRFKPEARKDGVVLQDIAAAAHAKLGAVVKEEFKIVPGLQLVKLPKGTTVSDAIVHYQHNPNVLYAEPNYLRYKDVIPNNPLFGQQWGLHNTGQTIRGVRGTPGADIDAVDAWDKTTGSNDVIVAVLDTGIDYREPDLTPNIVNGWDFITNSNDPMDRDGHGTHVAGIIAAEGNNGIGITGVMWKAKIMPLRISGPDGFPLSAEISAIDYANSHGASIINMSFGGPRYSQAEKDAIDSSHALCVCSAGNNGADNDKAPHYPSSYVSNNIISVGATDQNDTLASFSDYGSTSVQVAAPGTNIVSTFPPYDQLFYDPFNDFAAWDVQTPWHITNEQYVSPPTSAMASSPGGSVVNATLTLKDSLDLTSKCGTYLSFSMKLNTVIDHDWFYIEASRDDIHWDPVAYLSGTGTEFSTYSLTNYDNSPFLKIRLGLTTDGKAGPSSIYIDNVKISAFDPSSTQQKYVFLDGTSMATPYVSGLAGLVKAMNTDLTSLQIRDAILKNIDDKSLLSGKVLTKGRINASKTLSSVASLPLSATTANAVPTHTRYLSVSGIE